MKNKIMDKWLYFPIIAIAIYFLIRIISQSQIMFVFPFDFANDWASHIARLFFLEKYGFDSVPNWYAGFDYHPFNFYSPGWFIFSLPIYFILKNVQVATFISLILIYIISLILLIYFGKYQDLSLTKRIAFFILLFANPLAIGYFLRLGRIPELFGWMLFILFALIIFWYKDNKINIKGILLITFIYTILFYSHLIVAILAVTLLLSLFLIKTNKGKIGIIISCFLILSLTSFFWYPILKQISNTVSSSDILQQLVLEGWFWDKVLSVVIPLLFFIMFYFYYKSNKSKKELIFFLPQLIIGVLHLSRLTPFIPVLNRILPDTYHIFFIFLALYLFFKIDLSKISNLFKRIIFYGLVILPIVVIISSLLITPWFIEHNDEVKDTLTLLPYVKETFLILGSEQSYSKAYYAYGAIYYDTKSLSGHATLDLPLEYKEYGKIYTAFEKNDCDTIIEVMNKFNLKEIITYKEHCESLIKCGLNQKVKGKKACLLIKEN